MNQQQQAPARPRLDALTGFGAAIVSFIGGGYLGLAAHNSYVAVIGMIVIFAVIVNIVRRRRMARAAAPAAQADVPAAPHGYAEYGYDPRYQR